jgi:CRISPR/Cas system CMR-associated protein Cmr5 small subunit
MPFDVNTIPKIRLTEKSINNVSIIKKFNSIYFLYRDGKQEMQLDLQTNKEIKEMYSSYDLAYGKILMSGLGFGILALWLSKKQEVKSIHILEISQEVVDIFLSKNTLPDNVTIEIADASKYKTDEYYDCILVDHYEIIHYKNQIKDMKKVAKNIPNHKLFWSWNIETVYTSALYNKYIPYQGDNKLIEGEDFSGNWEEFRKKTLNIPTVPALTPEKINEYIYTYANMMRSPYVTISK